MSKVQKMWTIVVLLNMAFIPIVSGMTYVTQFCWEHITTNDKAMVNLANTLCGIVAYFLCDKEQILKTTKKHMWKVILIVWAIYNIHVLVYQWYPVISMLLVSVLAASIVKFQDQTLEVIINHLYQGDDRSAFTRKQKIGSAIAAGTASVLTYLLGPGLAPEIIVVMMIFGNTLRVILHLILYYKVLK